ncbi:glycosyltransferase family 8 protein [Coniophora puteana RWD-64-598 SS2]|uniref:glycogenin glucosyltransferase n=1 Tax=Coniophora puteana (strain RWD-64-598) TaxID=741705 RepID=A0A5M3N879_CONPW|nr:glycosyltransferase family 8 protein [Coniophora puteana RWD-64-598 SS2]EIW87045.1 glycosyltransferase family 8 protein [Coniophora puteana RWD-64-598 SS2]
MSTTPFAFVTLLSSDSYLPGALALAGALKDVHADNGPIDFHIICLVTPETLDVSTIKLLRKTFDIAVGVEVISQQRDDGALNLLGRPDLDSVLTKLHVFRLTQYSKIIFLDADVLPVRPLSHLFHLEHEFSAVPDVGWPDIFNSGVMVLTPGEDKFDQLRQLLKTTGSWDGADQGLLNEWRGDDWHRLSFTYNTTPTAAYTYAPAYARFGKQISAIHFIGPNKPWNSIPYRAPGSAAIQGSSGETAPPPSLQAYDYGSLVDRWYAVYDKHYRSQSHVPDTEVDVRRYVSAWDEQSGAGAEFLSSVNIPVSGGLSLEELRRMAIHGMGSANVHVNYRGGGEGEYITLPLEGRIDLMRPVPFSAHEWDSNDDLGITPKAGPHTPPSKTGGLYNSPFRTETLPTPDPRDVPSAPQPQSLSLPSSPFGVMTPSSAKDIPGGPQKSLFGKHLRPNSPPLLAWNPAVESPPKSSPLPSAFPAETYFPNAWDDSPTNEGQQQGSRASRSQKNKPTAAPLKPHELFNPPPPSEIPELLLRQGHYKNLVGSVHDSVTTANGPDPTKIKRVFPWEERPRYMPTRVFPGEEGPPSGSGFVRPPLGATAVTPEKSNRSEEPPSPLVGFQVTTQYGNAWDSVASIQKYASRLARPSPLAPAVDPSQGDHREWEEHSEASSRDGDVEDEGDSEEEGKTVRQHSRTSSSMERKQYRSIGIQTDRTKHVSTGVQAKEPAAFGKTDSKHSKKKTRRPSLNSRRQWMPPAASQPAGLPAIKAEEAYASPEGSGLVSPGMFPSTRLQTVVFPPSESPTGIHTPTVYDSPPGSRTPSGQAGPASGVIATSQASATLSAPPRLQVNTAGHPSSVSETSGTSPNSSLLDVGGISSQTETTTPSPTRQRKPSRVFDPARGVDVFKRGSEEVLARFLKMGSWGEQSHQHGQ